MAAGLGALHRGAGRTEWGGGACCVFFYGRYVCYRKVVGLCCSVFPTQAEVIWCVSGAQVCLETIEHFCEYPRRTFDTGNSPVCNVKFEYFDHKVLSKYVYFFIK